MQDRRSLETVETSLHSQTGSAGLIVHSGRTRSRWNPTTLKQMRDQWSPTRIGEEISLSHAVAMIAHLERQFCVFDLWRVASAYGPINLA